MLSSVRRLRSSQRTARRIRRIRSCISSICSLAGTWPARLDVPPVVDPEHIPAMIQARAMDGIGTGELFRRSTKVMPVVDHVVGNLVAIISRRSWCSPSPSRTSCSVLRIPCTFRRPAADHPAGCWRSGLLQVALHVGNQYRQLRGSGLSARRSARASSSSRNSSPGSACLRFPGCSSTGGILQAQRGIGTGMLMAWVCR